MRAARQKKIVPIGFVARPANNPALKLVTATGDLTVHCSDTLHRAHRPTQRPRKVVYTGFRQPLMEGDVVEEVPVEEQRAARAGLTDVQDRIADAGAGAEASEFASMPGETT